MNNPLCILAAGLGSRLGSYTNAINKALLPVNGKAVISHIIEKMPIESDIIVALGYQGKKIKDYCLIAYPNRNFIFVDVDNYDQAGSGPGLSILSCKKYLQRPFYFCTVDCIVSEDFPEINTNWLGVNKTNDPQSFSTVDIDSNGNIVAFLNKSIYGYDNAFIGLAGIKSYEYFWNNLKGFEIVSAFENCNNYPDSFFAHNFTWFDTGTIDNYAKAKRHFEGDQHFDFDKTGEFTYIVGDRVIKYFDDKKRVEKRVLRSKKIKGVPFVDRFCDNFFSYQFEPGKTIYESVEEVDPIKLFNWFEECLWEQKEYNINFQKSCYEFYYNKTFERFEAYKKKKNIVKDTGCLINGVYCQPVECYLEKIDWSKLTDGIPVVFHGDLQFDNIIVKPDGNFMLLDWRDCFADQLYLGDLFYDYAKLNGCFTLPYNIIKSGDFVFNCNKGEVSFSYTKSRKLKEFKGKFDKWIGEKYKDKVEILTTLIYLNMAPLHASPFDDLVFNLAKLRMSTLHNKDFI